MTEKERIERYGKARASVAEARSELKNLIARKLKGRTDDFTLRRLERDTEIAEAHRTLQKMEKIQELLSFETKGECR